MEKIDKDTRDDLLNRIQFKSLPYDVKGNYDRLQGKMRRREIIPAGNQRFQIWRFVGIAASLAFFIMTTYHLITSYSPEEVVWYEITAVSDAKTKVILPDSSAVWLNANASLRYPRTFKNDRRDVCITGNAMFEVRKGEKPFYVELDDLRIKVLGTTFNVITNNKENEIEITLLEGKIALYKQDNLTDTPDRILEPGEQAIYTRSVRDLMVSVVRPEAVTSWVTGNFCFEGNTLMEIVSELERAFHTKIHIENESMRQKTFNAVFEDKETLEEILSILQISARYTIEKRKGEIYIF